jgi:hypothetical protein
MPSCEALGFRQKEVNRLRTWYETCKALDPSGLNPAQAEQKKSRHAREEFCHAAPNPSNHPGCSAITTRMISGARLFVEYHED